MTTVIVDKETKTMYADGMISYGYTNFNSKKLVKTDEYILGFSGNVSNAKKFIEYFLSKKEDEEFEIGLDEEDYFSVLILDKNGTLTHYDNTMVGLEIEDRFHAIGTGGTIARGIFEYELNKGNPINKLDVKIIFDIVSNLDNATGKLFQVERFD